MEEIIGIFGKNGNRDDYDNFGGFTVFFWIYNIKCVFGMAVFRVNKRGGWGWEVVGCERGNKVLFFWLWRVLCIIDTRN